MKHLGKQSRKSVTKFDLIPWNGNGDDMEVQLDCTEFTSHCPVTGQPDFGRLVIAYRPDRHIIETKSLKLYLWRFRGEAAFNERIVSAIADDVMRQVKPYTLKVVGAFNTRGGISVTATAERFKE